MGVIPDAIGIFGAVLVLGTIVGIALEEHYISDKSHEDRDKTGE